MSAQYFFGYLRFRLVLLDDIDDLAQIYFNNLSNIYSLIYVINLFELGLAI